jgi:hypothetical protein
MGVQLHPDEERQLMLDNLEGQIASAADRAGAVALANDRADGDALRSAPAGLRDARGTASGPVAVSDHGACRCRRDDEDIAFASAAAAFRLDRRRRKLTSRRLTEIYLARIAD